MFRGGEMNRRVFSDFKRKDMLLIVRDVRRVTMAPFFEDLESICRLPVVDVGCCCDDSCFLANLAYGGFNETFFILLASCDRLPVARM